MPLVTMKFNPTVNKEGTQYSAELSWYDTDKVRFRKGRIESIGGWQKLSQETVKGVTRSLKDWGTAGAQYYIGIGTNLKFYVESGGSYQDITPIRLTSAAGDATFSATDGSSLITVTEVDHGSLAGDFVTFSGASSLGGNITADVLNQEYQVNTFVDADNFTIIAKDTNGDEVTANASDTGNGGASTVAEYQIPIGTNAYVSGGGGWGTGAWSSGAWGTSPGLVVSSQLRLYSQDVFGNDLIFCPRLGGIYYWDESGGARAVPLSDLSGATSPPNAALQVMVSDVDRHVIAFGAAPLGSSNIDPLLVRWSDQENAAKWAPTATNSAGGQVIATGTSIIGAVKARQEIIIFTDEGLHSMRYIGAPFIYSFSLIANNVSMASPNAGIAIGDAVFFMDIDGFYVYNGGVQRIPCDVFAYVFENFNQSQKFKVFAYNNPDFSEITWFYPVGEGNTDVTNYVTFNYVESNWCVGTLSRGAMIHAATRTNPIGASNDLVNISTNYLYTHEDGYDADGEPLNAYAESGDFELGEGDSFYFSNRIIPDFRLFGNPASAEITVDVKGRDFPMDDLVVLDTAEITQSATQNHIRARARQMSVRFSSAGTGYGWTLGNVRFQFRTDGRR